MRILLFPGLTYATDSSQEKANMGPGFYRPEGARRGFCKVGRDEEGAFLNSSERAAACIALENARRYAESQRPLILLTDTECLLMAIQNGLGNELIQPSKHPLTETFYEKFWSTSGRGSS